ncbi:MAG: hypothetical protein HUU06_11035, partial [Planctomycetaceae bacterium]|nr:hypothetical protein [Planctomycetaceae bacterium]
MTVRRGGGGDLRLDLRADLAIRLAEVDGRALSSLAREEKDPRPGIARYRFPVLPGSGDASVVVAWGGTIREDVRKAGDLAFVAGDHSRGTISPAGTFLTDATGWLPLDGSMAAASVRATVPEGWTVATQGGVPTATTAEGRTTFDFPPGIPCDGLWLQAGKWRVERRTVRGGVSAGTFLSEGNTGLSGLLLDSVEEYLALYERVLGPYPHAKFDIVENFFTTGYGMPAATLLGGDVIQHIGMMAGRSGGRIPPGYIDHELVHCWWGNGVFVDYDSGNWCEALTSYCSNYLRKEWESAEEGAKHRRGTRARYAARVSAAKDYPLRRFTGKTEDFENDIGYGKGSMVFHRIRRAVGDDAFFGALRDVVKEFTGRRASWDDLRQAFERRGGRQLKAHLDQYLDRTGAPVVLLEGAAAAADAEGWQVTGAILQRGEPWFLTLPLVVETAAGRETTTVDVSGERTPFSVRTRSLPLRVLLDPDSECWRGYAPGEAPAMLDATLQDPAGVVFTVSAGGKEPFLPVTEALRQRQGVREGTAGGAEGASSRLLLRVGDPGTLADLLPLGSPVKPVPGGVSVGGQSFRGEDVAVLASFRPAAGSPAAGARSCTLYWGASPAALSSARRVFFYGGDGVVVFRAGRPVLRLEPEGDESTRAALLEGLFPGVDAGRSLALVEALCAKEVEGRLAGSVEGAKAGKLLAGALVEDGHAVRVQEFSFEVPTWDGTPSCDGP